MRGIFLDGNGMCRGGHFMNMEMQYAIEIEPRAYRQLEEESREEQRDKSEIVNDLIRRHMLLRSMKKLRAQIEPQARALGYLTDEDIFREVS